MELKIQNITSTGSVNQSLDLEELARRLWNVEYNPRRFNALVLRMRKPRVTALIFHTGKIVIVGAKSEADSKTGGEKACKLIRRASGKKKLRHEDFRVQNIVASGKFPYHINLGELSEQRNVYYQPEKFSPACQLRYKIGEKLIALIFQSGKLIFTGTTDYSKIDDFSCYLRRFLLRFRH